MWELLKWPKIYETVLYSILTVGMMIIDVLFLCFHLYIM